MGCRLSRAVRESTPISRFRISRSPKKRFRCSWLLLWPLAFASGAGADTREDAANLIVSCARDADEDLVGLTNLDAECPGLEPALVAAGWAPFLSAAQAEKLTSAALSDLAQLLEHDRQVSTARPLQIDAVAQIARQLQQASTPRALSWRERLSQWVRQFFDRRQAQDGSWLADWLRDKSLPQQVTDIVVTALTVLVIVLALVVLINELRAAGVFRRRALRRIAGAAGGSVAESSVPPSFADIAAAPLRDQPSLLLQLVVSALVDTGRLAGARGLTHRELANRARFDTVGQLEQFALLATGAERVRYGCEVPLAAQIDDLRARGLALHAQIVDSAGTARQDAAP